MSDQFVEARIAAHQYLLRALATYEGMLHGAFMTLGEMASSSAYKALVDAYNILTEEMGQYRAQTCPKSEDDQ